MKQEPAVSELTNIKPLPRLAEAFLIILHLRGGTAQKETVLADIQQEGIKVMSEAECVEWKVRMRTILAERKAGL